MTSRKRNGFTLVELLVVIGIIALLISILMPALTKARQAAQKTVCLSRLHQFSMGTRLWQDDHKGKTFRGAGWAASIKPYMKTDQMYYCPSDDNPFLFGPDNFLVDILNQAYDLALDEGPMVHKAQISSTSYRLMMDDAPDPSQGDHDYNDVVMQVDILPNNKVKVTFVSIDAGYSFDLVDAGTRQVVMPNLGRSTQGGTSVITEGGFCSYGFNYDTDTVFGKNGKILGMDYYKIVANSAGDDKTQWDMHRFARHNGMVNVLWTDGSATSVPYRQINPFLPNVARQYWIRYP